MKPWQEKEGKKICGEIFQRPEVSTPPHVNPIRVVG